MLRIRVYYLLFLFCCFSAKLAIGQQNEVDSLLKVLPTLTDKDSQKVIILNDLSYAIHTINASKAKKYGEEALELAKKQGFLKEEARAYKSIGSAHHMEGEMKEAITYYQKNLAISKVIGDTVGVAVAMGNLAVAEEDAGNYRNAINMYLEVLPIFKSIHHQLGENICYNNLAGAYDNLALTDSVIYYYQKSIWLSEEIKDSVGIAYGLRSIGSIYKDLNEYQKTLDYYEQALDIFNQIGYSKGQALALQDISTLLSNRLGRYDEAEKKIILALKIAQSSSNKHLEREILVDLGALYNKKNKYQLALGYFRQALTISENINDKRGIEHALRNIGWTLIDLKRYDEAEPILTEALKKSKELKDIRDIQRSYEALGDLYEATEDHKKALYNFKLSEALEDSTYNSDKTKIIAEMQARFEGERQQKALELANEREAIVVAELRYRNTLLFGTIVGGSLALILAFIFLRARNQQQKANYLLSKQNTEIKQVNAEILAQDEEIKTQKDLLEDRFEAVHKLSEEKSYLIGVVAHDLKSPLNQIKGLLDILNFEKDSFNESSQNMLGMIRTTTNNMSEMIAKILNAQQIETNQINIHLEKVNLVDLVIASAKEFRVLARKKSIQIEIEDFNKKVYGNIDSKLLRQILENLLSNAIKFSEFNKQINILFQEGDKNLRIGIQDQGPGITLEEQEKLFQKFQKLSNKPTDKEASTGLGLSIVKKYAEAMYGKVWCESTGRNGSTFWLEFPVVNMGV